MRTSRIGVIALGIAVGLSAVSFAASDAAAQKGSVQIGSGKKGSAQKDSAQKDSTSNASKSSTKKGVPSKESIEKGVTAYLARDYAGATAAFEEAVRVDPTRAYAYYMLGQALRAEKKYEEAEAAWQKGVSRANTDPNTRCKLLFVIADMREEQHRWDEAISAWKEYSAFLASAPKITGFPETATERIKVIEKRKEMQTEYGKTKDRIEQRERDATSGT